MVDPQTPPRSGSFLTPDTLVVPKQTSSGAYRKRGLEKRRDAVIDDLGSSVPEVPVDFFLEFAAPQINGVNFASVKRMLLVGGHIQHDRWIAFPEDPAASKLHEDKAFQPLGNVFQSIISCSGLDSSATYLHFHENAHKAPLSSRGNKTRPDSYFARHPSHPSDPKVISGQGTVIWSDIAVSGEYKKNVSDDDVDDNVRKIIWSMHHIMRDDPCRRFTFGFTVENIQMRLWFVSRSTVFVTKPFNFMQDHDSLIRFVLSFTNSKPEGAGWDPTVCRTYVADQECYDITVHALENGQTVPVVYRTEGILSSFAADALRGRGTRVFRARMLNQNTNKVEGDPVALKDVWVDHDRLNEGEIRRRIEEDATDEDKPRIRQYFMTVLHHGTVLINYEKDHTRDLILRNAEVPSDDRFILRRKMDRAEPTTSTGSIPMVDTPGRARARHASHYLYSAKIHYRIVYREVAEALHTIKSLAVVIQSLIDGTRALELLHQCGWVHRDVSCGNLLVFNGGGKLSDLEYSKKMSQESTHEIRTGTLDFMPVEVELERYAFLPRIPIATDISEALVIVPQAPVFRYNPLHDLESLWWIALWMIFNHRDNRDEKVHSSAEQQAGYARLFFPGILRDVGRLEVLQLERTLYNALPCLPISFQAIALRLEVIRRGLVEHYQKAEAGPQINGAAFHGIHGLFLDELTKARNPSGEVQLFPLAPTPTSKRTRGDSVAAETGTGSSGATSPTPKSKSKRAKVAGI